MKVFTAATATQGQRTNDFCHVPEDEIVMFGVLLCTNETTDGDCGCHRSLCGVKSSKATTTMKVSEFDGTMQDLKDIIHDALQAGGWLTQPYDEMVDPHIATKLVRAANRFPVGTVVEYRDRQFAARKEVV